MNDYGGGCRRRGVDVDLLSRVIIWVCVRPLVVVYQGVW